MRLLRSVFVAFVLWLVPQTVSAACAALPYTFTNTVSTIDANTTNANNQTLRSCVTNIDWTQIGTAGIYPSQLIPLTTSQATFGGSAGLTYGFPGPVLIALPGGVSAYAPPVYMSAGTATATTEHIVRGSVSIPVGVGTNLVNVTVPLSGAAAFTAAGSYVVTASYDGTGSSFPGSWNAATITVYAARSSGTAMVFVCANGSSSTTSGNVVVDFIAIGY